MDRIKVKYLLTAAVIGLFAPVVWGLTLPQGRESRSDSDTISSVSQVDVPSVRKPASVVRRDRRNNARNAQPELSVFRNDSLTDSLSATTHPDTLGSSADTVRKKKKSAPFLEDIISGKNRDSLIFDVEKNIVHIYNEGDVTYQSSNLKADYMRINMDSKEIFAYGKADSVEGKATTTHPVFQEGAASYTMDTITYNINTKKAKIKGVATQEGDGWLIGGNVKKMADNTINIKDGKYTTCDHTDHPHFYLAMTRAKVIPGKKVISGPAYLVMEDVPIYFLGIPEGFFPINSGPKSGILMPTYGEEYTRGFYIRDLGYYFTLGEHADLALRGGIYTLGSWEASAASSYIKRYKYTGRLGARFASVQVGEKGQPDFIKSSDFSLDWTHSQDPKANPGSTFSASVTFKTSGYNKYAATSIPDIQQTQTNSTINYSKNWVGTPFSINVNMSVSQNAAQKSIDVTLPSLVFNVSRFKPFKRKELVGKERWYEKITMSYTGNLTNSVAAKESTILTKETLKNMKNGIQHKIPISASFNLFGYINISPAFNYTENWYFKKVDQKYNPTTNQAVTLDPEYGFWRVYNYNTSLSASTIFYGMYETKKKSRKLQAVRHTITPSVGISYNPNFSGLKYGFYKMVQTDSTGRFKPYSPFSDNAFPPSSSREAASMSFSLSQTLEMKVLSKRDTSGVKKIKIIDELAIDGSYNFIADSMRLSQIGLRLRSTIFKNFGINLSARLDPYRVTPDGKLINKLFFPGRIVATGWTFSYSFKSRSDKSTPAINDPASLDPLYANPFSDPYGRMDPVLRRQYMSQAYYDFSMPWNLTVGYNINYSVQYGNFAPKGYKPVVQQNVNLSGSLTITPKTGITFSANYDIARQEFSSPQIAISRDLHCWQMSFTWIPIGYYRSWNFNIGVKASSLADLKYDKSESMYDNMF